MASVGFTGKGGVVSISSDNGNAYTVVAQVKSAKFSGGKVDFTDITNLSSPGSVREVLPTLNDPGTLSLDIVANQLDPGQLMLSAAYNAQTLLKFKVQYPAQQGALTGLVRTGNCYVSSDGMASLDVAEASTFTTELKLTSLVTDTAATSAS